MKNTRLVQISDDEGIVLLANTNLTDLEIETACNFDDEKFSSLDYEERCELWAETLNKTFNRVYAEDILV